MISELISLISDLPPILPLALGVLAVIYIIFGGFPKFDMLKAPAIDMEKIKEAVARDYKRLEDERNDLLAETRTQKAYIERLEKRLRERR